MILCTALAWSRAELISCYHFPTYHQHTPAAVTGALGPGFLLPEVLSWGQTVVFSVEPKPVFSLLVAYKQMLMFPLVFLGVHYSSLTGPAIAVRVSSGVKTLITALAKHTEIIYFTNTQKILPGWD